MLELIEGTEGIKPLVSFQEAQECPCFQPVVIDQHIIVSLKTNYWPWQSVSPEPLGPQCVNVEPFRLRSDDQC